MFCEYAKPRAGVAEILLILVAFHNNLRAVCTKATSEVEMPMFKITIVIKKFQDTLDPEGIAVKTALHSLGHTVVNDVRMGKTLDFNLEADDESSARTQAEAVAKSQTNDIYEKFEVSVRPG